MPDRPVRSASPEVSIGSPERLQIPARFFSRVGWRSFPLLGHDRASDETHAAHSVSDRGESGLAEAVKKFRVHDTADQDGIADRMRGEFPGMFYILNKAPADRDKREAVFRGMHLTGDESLTSRAWIEGNVHSQSPLGALYPTRTWTAPNRHGCLKEGDTPSWFFFLPRGGNDPSDTSKPGWGGQFQRAGDGWFHDPPATKGVDPRASVSRWRPEFQRDFAERMKWTRTDK